MEACRAMARQLMDEIVRPLMAAEAEARADRDRLRLAILAHRRETWRIVGTPGGGPAPRDAALWRSAGLATYSNDPRGDLRPAWASDTPPANPVGS
jgi:hypothetical protein